MRRKKILAFLLSMALTFGTLQTAVLFCFFNIKGA